MWENASDYDPEVEAKLDKKFSEVGKRLPEPIPPPPPKFLTKDSGKREEFSTGAKRGDQSQKTRYDLIPTESLRRLADLYLRGSVLYGESNFKKGVPYLRVYASLLRHVFAWREGDVSEDHMAAVAWNAFALIFYDEMIRAGKLPKELDDREEVLG